MNAGAARKRRADGGDWFFGRAAAASLLNTSLLALAVIGTGIGLLEFVWADRYLGEFVLTALLVVGVGVSCRVQRAAHPLRSTLVFAGALGCFLVGWRLFCSRGPERDELQSEGDALVARIESFREQNGQYPATLDEVGSAPRWNRFGGWQYEPLEEVSYRLRVGDYGKDGFILYRSAESAGWEWDG